MNVAVALRRAGAADAAAVAACVRRAYGKYDGRLPQPPKPVLADYDVVVRETDTWVLEDGGRCVGVVVLVPAADHVLLENIAVEPEQQGRGFGRLLLDFVETEARRLGTPEVRLYTNALMTENQAIYARRGYVETERRRVDGREAVYMRKRVS